MMNEYIRISFLLMAELYSIVYIPHFINPFICLDRHPGYFYLLVTVNNASINIGVQVSVPAFNSFGYIPRSRIAESYGNSI